MEGGLYVPFLFIGGNMKKIVSVVDHKRFDGDISIIKKVAEFADILAPDGYILRSGKYDSIQSIMNEKYEESLRKLNVVSLNKIFVFEECPKTKQLMGSTRHYNILYNESKSIQRYRKKIVVDKKGFDDILFQIIGKRYKFVSEVYREKYRLFLAQLLGEDLSNISKTEIVITYNLLKQENIRTYDIINGTEAFFYDIMEEFGIENYDIREI